MGAKLLTSAENLAAAAGATVLWLTPWVHNHRALAFYSRRGYEDFGLTFFTFEGESHENRLLAKSLRATSAVLPNPSLNRSANGRPPSPGWWYTVHFRQPGLGVLPLSPG